MPGKKKTMKKAPGKEAGRERGEKHSLEKGIEQFGEEISRLGERLGARAEAKGKEWEKWFRSTFGILGPLVSGIFGIVILALLIWFLAFVNVFVGSGVLSNVQFFMLSNMGLILLIMLFFSYASYFSATKPALYRLFSPVFVALKVLVAFWFAAHFVRIANLSVNNPGLAVAGSWLELVMYPVFWIIVLLGYLAILVRISECGPGTAAARALGLEAGARGGKRPGPEGRRLYRSGKERILGGVCGGIAEYLGIDPVIIRLLFILITLPYGFGIFLYIILWIIMPRNPRHKWD
jgi:phage shock protein C